MADSAVSSSSLIAIFDIAETHRLHGPDSHARFRQMGHTRPPPSHSLPLLAPSPPLVAPLSNFPSSFCFALPATSR